MAGLMGLRSKHYSEQGLRRHDGAVEPLRGEPVG